MRLGEEELYYRVVLYETERMLPYRFETWAEADDYIYLHHLHAYITIM